MKFSDCVQQIWVMQNSPEVIGWTLKDDWLVPIRYILLKYHLMFISRLIILDFTFISINVVDANYVASQLLLVMQCSTDAYTDAEIVHTQQCWRSCVWLLFAAQFLQKVTTKLMSSNYKWHDTQVGLRGKKCQFLEKVKSILNRWAKNLKREKCCSKFTLQTTYSLDSCSTC